MGGNKKNRNRKCKGDFNVKLNYRKRHKRWDRSTKSQCEELCKKECKKQADIWVKKSNKGKLTNFKCGCEYEDRNPVTKYDTDKCSLKYGNGVDRQRAREVDGKSRWCHVQDIICDGDIN